MKVRLLTNCSFNIWKNQNRLIMFHLWLQGFNCIR